MIAPYHCISFCPHGPLKPDPGDIQSLIGPTQIKSFLFSLKGREFSELPQIRDKKAGGAGAGGILALVGSSLDNNQTLNRVQLPAPSLLCDLGRWPSLSELQSPQL